MGATTRFSPLRVWHWMLVMTALMVPCGGAVVHIISGYPRYLRLRSHVPSSACGSLHDPIIWRNKSDQKIGVRPNSSVSVQKSTLPKLKLVDTQNIPSTQSGTLTALYRGTRCP